MPKKTAFVTVGTTAFDALVRAVDSDACLDELLRRGFARVLVQRGTGKHVPRAKYVGKGGGTITIEHFRHSPSLAENIAEADLVLSHGGAGTIMEVLRARRPLVVVVNAALMGNHQVELAVALGERGHLVSTTPDELVAALGADGGRALTSLKPYGEPDAGAFASLVDDEMGFGFAKTA